VDDELREGGVESTARERQSLGRRLQNVDTGVPRSGCGHERPGGIDRGDRRGSDPVDELGRQRAGAAADVQHALTCAHSSEVGELRREQHRVPAHEAVVRTCRTERAHGAAI
jgi:hypothetical protein